MRDDLARAAGAVRSLENAVLGLRARLHDNIDVQRLSDDVVRCAADLGRLEQQAAGLAPSTSRETIVVPDGEYDVGLWAEGDVDDEGLGVPGRRAP